MQRVHDFVQEHRLRGVLVIVPGELRVYVIPRSGLVQSGLLFKL